MELRQQTRNAEARARKLQSDIKFRTSQHRHDSHKAERQYAKLQERLRRLLADAGGGRQPELDLKKTAPRIGDSRSKWARPTCK